MGSEAALRSVFKDRLAPFGLIQRVENRVEAGTPDVLYLISRLPAPRPAATGWVELKYIGAWPARASTPVRSDTLTLAQVLFLEGWTRAGGRAWLLTQIGRGYLFLNGSRARLLLDGVPRDEIVARADVWNPTSLTLRDLVGCLAR